MDETQATIQEKAATLAILDLKKKELEEQTEAIKLQIKEVQTELLPLMRGADVQKFTTSRGTFYISTTERPRVVDSEKAFEFFRGLDCGHIIKETIHGQTLLSTYCELREAGKIDLFSAQAVGLEVHVDERVKITHSKTPKGDSND